MPFKRRLPTFLAFPLGGWLAFATIGALVVTVLTGLALPRVLGRGPALRAAVPATVVAP